MSHSMAFAITENPMRAVASVLCAHRLNEGLRLAEQLAISATVLDFGPSDGEASEFCERLKQPGVPFVLDSGSGHVAGACRSGMIATKTAGPTTLIDALHQAL
jgi:DNA-binding response OmpR family regulator